MSYAYLFKYIIIGDTGKQNEVKNKKSIFFSDMSQNRHRKRELNLINA